MRGKVLRRNLQIGTDSMRIYLSPDAQLKYLKPSGGWDKDLLDLTEKFIPKSAEVWDIGANVGVFSFAAAMRARTGRIFAFEPDTFLCEVMKRTKREASFNHVQIIPLAMSGSSGIAEFLIAQRGRASNSLASAGGRSQMGGVRENLLVPTICGDDFAGMVRGKPDFIKIDVEGAERDVLFGMKNTIARYRPHVYVEVGVDSRDDVYDFFQSLNYSTSQIFSGTQNILFSS